VRTSSLAALAEMRSMIMVLRTGDDDLIVPGGLERLPELVASATADGLRVEAHLPEITGIPMVVAHTVYRIVRESFTNARKHSPASRVRLTLSHADDAVTVTVTNTLTHPADLGHNALSAGTGLASMRERAVLLGGSLTSGRQGDTWQVRATLPVHEREAAL
jgi:signal transduction histidine kinase